MKKTCLLILSVLITFASFADEGCESYDHDDISVDSVWRGEVTLKKPLVVKKKAHLKVLEGATVIFDMPPNNSIEPPPWIYVEGELSVEGSFAKPVTFKNIGKMANPAVQDMINVMEGERVAVTHATFEGAGWALHIHKTPSKVSFSTFRNGYGGARFNNDGMVIENSAFVGNKIGIRTLASRDIAISSCDFTDNLTGIFFRRGINNPRIAGNNFADAEYDIKLGEGQEGKVEAGGNWWAAYPDGMDGKIYDGNDSEGVGKVNFLPAAKFPFERGR